MIWQFVVMVLALINQNGDSVYTRDGQFYIDAQGDMVNSMGHQFSDESGSSIQTVPGGGEITVDKEGQVFQGNQNIAQLGVFTFENHFLTYKKLVVVLSRKIQM